MSEIGDGFEPARFRVEVPINHPLALALRPSREVMERLAHMERVRLAAFNAVRNMLIGSVA